MISSSCTRDFLPGDFVSQRIHVIFLLNSMANSLSKIAYNFYYTINTKLRPLLNKSSYEIFPEQGVSSII